MRNLELVQLIREPFKDSFKGFNRITFSKEYVYVLKDKKIIIYNKTGEEIKTIQHDLECTTNFEILRDVYTRLWFGTGEKFIALRTTDNETIEYLHIPKPFFAAEWNLLQEHIAVFVKDVGIVVYSPDYLTGQMSPIQTHLLYVPIENPFIQVGWGSSRTQFKSTVSKKSVEEPEDSRTDFDDILPRISWSSDDYYAVNYVFEGKRRFRTHNLFNSEEYECNVTGLQPVIAWRPNHNSIVCHIWTNRRCDIVFYEKNCLEKTRFKPPSINYILDIKWSPCGQILAIHQHHEEQNTNIYLYSLHNFQWLLKQQLKFFKDSMVLNFTFVKSPSLITVLHITTPHELLKYQFKFGTCFTETSYTNNTITAAAIDGSKLYLRDCREGFIPEPLNRQVVQNSAAINFVIFHPKEAKFSIIDCDNVITVFEYNKSSTRIIGNYKLIHDDKFNIPLKLHDFCWPSNDKIICLADVDEESVLLRKKCTITMTYNVTDLNCVPFNVEFSLLEESEKLTYMGTLQTNIIIQDLNGIRLVKNTDESQHLTTYAEYAIHLRLSLVENQIYVFALNARSEFFVNEYLVMEGVTSFVVHDNYLYLTTDQNTLKCVRLTETALRKFCKIGTTYPYTKTIEPGSIVLFDIPKNCSVVLETPRGNLELCTCRMIALDMIERTILQKDWLEALNIVRINKLSTSVLIDLDIDRFIDSIAVFVDSVENLLLLNDFILGIQLENLLSTIYSDCDIQPKSDKTVDKLSRLCTEMIEYMKHKNYLYYLNAIVLACFISNTKFGVREALKHIQVVMHSISDNRNIIIDIEKALQCLKNLASNDDIYNEALQIYDLDLVLFVAQNLNMDPKIFEPFIAELRALNENRRRFRINDYLNQPQKAVVYLINCSNDNSEILDYITQHNVHRQAYDFLDSDSDLFKTLSYNYGNILNSNGKYEDAGLIFVHASFYKNAMEAYAKALAWRNVISIIKIAKISIEESNIILCNLSDELISKGRVLEAAQIEEFELKNYEKAIELMINSKQFNEAITTAKKYDRRDIYETDICPAIHSYCRTLLEKFQNMRKTFLTYKDRLLVIRELKRQESMKERTAISQFSVYNGIRPFEEGLEADFAEGSVTTGRTTSSKMTSKTSRTKRKEERKRENLRPGNVYEDIALIKALHNVITEAFQYGPEVRELCYIQLMKNDQDVHFVRMHEALRELQTDMMSSVENIWPPDLNNIEESLDPDAAAIHNNVKYLEIRCRTPPTNLNINWSISLLSI